MAKVAQYKTYEFKPNAEISEEQVFELSEKVRIGITGRVLETLSEDLKKHFVEIKDGQMGKAKNSNKS